MSETICTCYTSHNLNTGKDEHTLSRTCPVHLEEANAFYTAQDAKASEAAARTKAVRTAIDVDALNDKAHKAAREICEAFDVRQPRGVRYHNTNEKTIAIIIAQSMKGIHR